MTLTDTAIRTTKPRVTPFKLTDSGGLRLLVKPNGAKLWRLAYRYGGKQKTLAIGIYPAVTVAEARSGRDAARKLLTTGIDPSVKRTPTAWFIGEVCAQKGILIQSRRS